MKQRTCGLESYKGTASRHTCPSCGRPRCFTWYVDESHVSKGTPAASAPIFPGTGRCDHESGCGYHYTPRQYLADHPHERDYISQQSQLYRRPFVAPPPPPPSFLQPDVITAAEHGVEQSPLFVWLTSWLPTDRVLETFRMYHVGYRDGGTVWPQIDSRNRVRTAKLMQYGPDGHRNGRVTWLHPTSGYNLAQVYFGLHLISDKSKKIAIVESEKTAIVCRILTDSYIWLACGGCGNFRPSMGDLTGRDVLIFADTGSESKWAAKISTWPQRTSSMKLVPWAPDGAPANMDIADLLYQQS